VSGIPLGHRRHWIFDMDGTLTVAMHDFDAIRADLGLPAGLPILESLQALPPEVERAKRAQLDRLEEDLAHTAKVAPGAHDCLATLQRHGSRLGILTRNSQRNVEVTLEACGLAAFFAEADRVTRDDGPPKPDPGGIEWLLERWGATPSEAVMVGDYEFDLLSGRAAGCATVHVDPSGAFPWPELSDREVRSLAELVPELSRQVDS